MTRVSVTCVSACVPRTSWSPLGGRPARGSSHEPVMRSEASWPPPRTRPATPRARPRAASAPASERERASRAAEDGWWRGKGVRPHQISNPA
eukprot:5836457-Pleurochrysis_carterae.AAC.1